MEFDGVEFLDGNASDPNTLRWMQGSPPPADKIIRFADDRFLSFPRNRWSLSHFRELLPTVNVWRGANRPRELGTAPPDDAIDTLSFSDLNGRRLSWSESLLETYTDGIVILHRGRLVYERYFGRTAPRTAAQPAFPSPSRTRRRWRPC